MGVDAADFNNDGRPDLMVLDMLPEREQTLKTSANAESFDVYNQKLEAGYHPQYARNTLQLNRGRRRFRGIGYLAGVFATDWSWAPLFAHLDNDGYKDLFITSGIYHRPNDLDYLTYVSNPTVQASLRDGMAGLSRAIIEKMPHVPVANYARSEEHTSELQSPCNLVCRLLLEKKKKNNCMLRIRLVGFSACSRKNYNCYIRNITYRHRLCLRKLTARIYFL